MEIIHNLNSNYPISLATIKGGKRIADALQSAEKELLIQMSETFNIVNGGQFKRRRQIA